jgi:hypothetical protein
MSDKPAETPDATSTPAPESLDPTKLLRLGMMTQEMLGETRRAPLDEQARERLHATLARTLEELREILPSELRDELADVSLPLSEEASEGELRLAQAQLVGWLEGLFHGIQASLYAQQMQMQAQAQGYPRRTTLPDGTTGQYL